MVRFILKYFYYLHLYSYADFKKIYGKIFLVLLSKLFLVLFLVLFSKLFVVLFSKKNISSYYFQQTTLILDNYFFYLK